MQRLLSTCFVGLALTLAACGSGDQAEAAEPIILIDGVEADADSTSSTSPTEADPTSGDADASSSEAVADADPSGEATDEELALEFADCLRDEGLDVNDPTVDADGTVVLRSIFGDDVSRIDEDARSAIDACSDILEGSTFGPGNGGVDPVELQDDLVEFAACLREQGLDVTDPDLSGGLGGAAARGPQGLFGLDIQDPQYQAEVDACSDLITFGPGARN